jgi:hypothetical protein
VNVPGACLWPGHLTTSSPVLLGQNQSRPDVSGVVILRPDIGRSSLNFITEVSLLQAKPVSEQHLADVLSTQLTETPLASRQALTVTHLLSFEKPREKV